MVAQLPLVSILIPVTQNTPYFQAALTSALFQTYDNIEIIIRDTTSTKDIERMIENEFLPYYNKIHYIKNNTSMNIIQLAQKLIDDSKGNYINFLSEKDLFYPLKVERMMQYFLSDEPNNIQLVTSSQLQLNEKGELDQSVPTNGLFTVDKKLNGIECGKAIVQKQQGMGEFTAPLFKKENLYEPFGYFRGTPFIYEYVTATWLSMLTKGEIVYIADGLSFKRNLPEQQVTNIVQKNEQDQLLSLTHQLG